MTTGEGSLLESWHGLQDRHARAICGLERALGEHDLGVSEFEVLEHLAGQREDSCRMQKLADVVHLSQSALSRVVGRLEEQGLVERVICHEDRRGIYAQLTPEGTARYLAARPAHRSVLAEVLGS